MTHPRPHRSGLWRALAAAASSLLAMGLPGCSTAGPPAPGGLAHHATPLASWFNTAAPAAVEVHPPLLVKPLVNGADIGWFFVDTGATGMVISPDSAAVAGLDPSGSVHVVGARRFDATNWRADQFELGPLHLRNVDFAGVDVSFISPGPGIHVAGIVGADVFRSAVVEIDMAERSVRLFDPRTYTLTGGSWREAAEVPGGLAVSATFEGDRRGLFIIDTGGDFGVAFDVAHPVAADVLRGRPTRGQTLRGVGGIEWGRAGQLQYLDLGGARLTPVSARFFNAGRLEGAGPGVLGLIGSQVLREFILVMDWGNNRVAFLPRD